jgi:hypothetical protein
VDVTDQQEVIVQQATGRCVGGAPDSAVRLGETDAMLNQACRMLLRVGAAIRVADLAAGLGTDPAALEPLIAEYERRGRMKRDGGMIIAALGLSAVPSEYEVSFGRRRMWAWCAKSALGLVSALRLGGEVAGRCPATGVPVSVAFPGDGVGHQADAALAVFWPADTMRDTCGSAETDYCPAFAILENAQAAADWAERQGFPGEVLTTKEAVTRAATYYAPVVDLSGLGGDLTLLLAG